MYIHSSSNMEPSVTTPVYQNFINGHFLANQSGETFDGEFKDGNLYHGMLTKSNGEKIRLINGKLEEKPTDLL